MRRDCTRTDWTHVGILQTAMDRMAATDLASIATATASIGTTAATTAARGNPTSTDSEGYTTQKNRHDPRTGMMRGRRGFDMQGLDASGFTITGYYRHGRDRPHPASAAHDTIY